MENVVTEQIKQIFVYGTLKPGHTYVEWNKYLYNEQNYNCTFQEAVLYNYYVYIAEYPLLVLEQNAHDQWEKFIKDVDNIEECPEEYTRKLMEIKNIKTNKLEQAWVYLMNESYSKDKQMVKVGSDFTEKHFKEYYENKLKLAQNN